YWIDISNREDAEKRWQSSSVPKETCVTGIGAANRPDVRRLARANPNENEAPLIYFDQSTRFNYVWVAFGAFAVLGLLVNPNWTSLHGFYRDRLADAYIEPIPDKERAIPLSALENPNLGAPYHLISGTLN